MFSSMSIDINNSFALKWKSLPALLQWNSISFVSQKKKKSLIGVAEINEIKIKLIVLVVVVSKQLWWPNTWTTEGFRSIYWFRNLGCFFYCVYLFLFFETHDRFPLMGETVPIIFFYCHIYYLSLTGINQTHKFVPK